MKIWKGQFKIGQYADDTFYLKVDQKILLRKSINIIEQFFSIFRFYNEYVKYLGELDWFHGDYKY